MATFKTHDQSLLAVLPERRHSIRNSAASTGQRKALDCKSCFGPATPPHERINGEESVSPLSCP